MGGHPRVGKFTESPGVRSAEPARGQRILAARADPVRSPGAAKPGGGWTRSLNRQAVSGGSGSLVASPGSIVDAVSGVQVRRDLVRRRDGRLRNFLASAAILVKYWSILRRLAANSWKATRTLWAATPRILRRSGSSITWPYWSTAR